MTEERDKLLQIMSSLESDYKSGKISAEKYRYFRSKYEDKLNSIDAMEATKRIRSMQGKPSTPKSNKKKRKPTNYKKKQEQDLVQKYIINPKKDDTAYNKKKKSSMSSGNFKFIAVMVLVIAFTAGVAYGIFNLDTETIAETNVVAIVEDTAFPEIVAVVNTTHENITIDDDNKTEEKVETTTETTTETTDDDSDDDSHSNTPSDNTPTPAPEPEPTPEPTPTPSPSPSPSPSDGGGSDDGGGDDG
jgi:hypothetical protein